MSSRNIFSQEEDLKLKHIIEEMGITNWNDISAMMPGRTTRQVRDRYQNYLQDTSSSPDPWSIEEDRLLTQKYIDMGPKWTQMATYFPGRKPNHLKNRWHTHISKYSSSVRPRNTEALLSSPVHIPAIDLGKTIGLSVADWDHIFSQMHHNTISLYAHASHKY